MNEIVVSENKITPLGAAPYWEYAGSNTHRFAVVEQSGPNYLVRYFDLDGVTESYGWPLVKARRHATRFVRAGQKEG